MAFSKTTLLDKAVEIVKNYASSSNASFNLETVLEKVYEKLVELNKKTEEE